MLASCCPLPCTQSLAVQVAKLQTVVAETREAAQQAAKDAAAAAKARDVQHKEQVGGVPDGVACQGPCALSAAFIHMPAGAHGCRAGVCVPWACTPCAFHPADRHQARRQQGG